MTEPSTRTAYDSVATLYAELFSNVLDTLPLERALLTAFAELVQAHGAGPVVDVGCGPGHLTAHLHSLGLDASGIDLSPEMIAIARRSRPDLRFEVGSMTGLDLGDATVRGLLANYSFIHTPPAELPAVFAEFARVLAPGGYALLGFYAGDEPEPQSFDHKVTLAYRWSPGRLADLASEAGFIEVARLVRALNEGERFQQGQLLLRRC